VTQASTKRENGGMSQQPTPQQFVEALRAGLGPVVRRAAEQIRQMHAALKPLIDYVEAHPEVLEQWEREREAEAQIGSCHCLCGAVHGTLGVCTSTAEPGLTVRFDSPTVGTQHVPFCRPCFEARAATAGMALRA
jgi:hypothetical protein